jgi:hypothetical protein
MVYVMTTCYTHSKDSKAFTKLIIFNYPPASILLPCVRGSASAAQPNKAHHLIISRIHLNLPLNLSNICTNNLINLLVTDIEEECWHGPKPHDVCELLKFVDVHLEEFHGWVLGLELYDSGGDCAAGT